MSLNMMRRNVLLDLGEAKGSWESDLIACPDQYKRVSLEGKILAVGPDCRQVSQGDVGKRAIMQMVYAEDRMLTPKMSCELWLENHYHFLAHEDKIVALLEE